jgi:ABC-2 type transport system permease protein
MINAIRAELYRIVRGKGIYITFTILFLFLVIIASTGQANVVSIEVEGPTEQSSDVTTTADNGMVMAQILAGSADNLAFFLLALIILVSAPMFSNATVKNELSTGMSRTQLYFSKLILGSALCVVLMLFYMGIGMLWSTLIMGFGGTPPDGYWIDLLKVWSAQLFMILALNCVGTFLVFLTKRTAMAIGLYLAFCLVPLLLISLLSISFPDIVDLLDYDLMGNLKKMAYLVELSSKEMTKAFAVGAAYIVASTVAGIVFFNRAEIK